MRRGVLLVPAVEPRADLATKLVARLRRAGLRVVPSTGWERFDARLLGSAFVAGDLVTSSHPEGWVQIAVVRRIRIRHAVEAGVLVWLTAIVSGPAAMIVVAAVLLECVRGTWRTGPLVRRVVLDAPRAAA